MKILQVNCVYKRGSTGKIVADIHRELISRGIDSAVCYGRGEVINEPNVYKTCGELYSKANNLWSRITGVMYGGCFISTNKLISVIKKEKPDIVHLHCINGYFVNIYRIITWLKRRHISTVLTLHAEFMYTANCGSSLDCDRWKTGCGNCPRLKQATNSWLIDNTSLSWKRMKKAFRGFNNLIVASVSPWLMERAKQSPILADKKHVVVMNGLDTSIFHFHDTDALRKQHDLGDEKVIFHATPFFSDDPNHLKGGHYVLRLAEMMKDENVKFFVAGDHALDLQVPDNVILLGRIMDQEDLARYYSMADVTLLTSKRETFSMILAESLCCGTRVVGFDAGGPESIGMPQYCTFIKYGDIRAVANRVRDSFAKSATHIAEDAAAKYSKTRMTQGYIEIYRG